MNLLAMPLVTLAVLGRGCCIHGRLAIYYFMTLMNDSAKDWGKLLGNN